MYYTRYPGVINGLGTIGLALYGDSPKAPGYLRLAHHALLEYGRARQWEDGSSAGGNYSIHHAFGHLATVITAW